MEDKQFQGNWIKLNRGLLDSYISTDSETLHLWITILLSANHKENSFVFNGKKITVNPGQFITGRKVLSAKTKISEWKIIRLLKLFESEQQITQQKTNKYTIISITNWAKYQQDAHQNAQQTNNKPTTNQQQTNTNKNDKKEKNDKNDNISICSVEHTNKEIQISSKPKSSIFNPKESIPLDNYKQILEDPTLANNDKDFLREQVRQMADWSAGSHKKKINWTATLRNWIRSSRQKGILPNGVNQKSKVKTFTELEHDWAREQREAFLKGE